jgi:hypothetical protein
MVRTKTFAEVLDQLPPGAVLQVLLSMVEDITAGKDATLAAFRAHVDAAGARVLLVGGVAVIVHGYRRTTDDRDVLVSHREVQALSERLMNDPDWERLEIRQYAFSYRPTGVHVDFLVSGDLVELGRPYLFPDPYDMESIGGVEGVQAIGLHDLFYLKLLAGRMQDMADIMELCKRHFDVVAPGRVLARLEPHDEDLRNTFLEIVRKAPIELANERRLGQQDSN